MVASVGLNFRHKCKIIPYIKISFENGCLYRDPPFGFDVRSHITKISIENRKWLPISIEIHPWLRCKVAHYMKISFEVRCKM